MKQEICVLPVQCKKCGAVFDLWYDLQEEERREVSVFSEHLRFDKTLNEIFCWRCRQNLIEGIEESFNADEEDEDEFAFDFE